MYNYQENLVVKFYNRNDWYDMGEDGEPGLRYNCFTTLLKYVTEDNINALEALNLELPTASYTWEDNNSTLVMDYQRKMTTEQYHNISSIITIDDVKSAFSPSDKSIECISYSIDKIN